MFHRSPDLVTQQVRCVLESAAECGTPCVLDLRTIRRAILRRQLPDVVQAILLRDIVRNLNRSSGENLGVGDSEARSHQHRAAIFPSFESVGIGYEEAIFAGIVIRKTKGRVFGSFLLLLHFIHDLLSSVGLR